MYKITGNLIVKFSKYNHRVFKYMYSFNELVSWSIVFLMSQNSMFFSLGKIALEQVFLQVLQLCPAAVMFYLSTIDAL
jgi:hypothetical protein